MQRPFENIDTVISGQHQTSALEKFCFRLAIFLLFDQIEHLNPLHLNILSFA